MAEASGNKRVIIICGATATGKTALAIDTAKLLHTSIISCDSRQCYREMSIGVAKPSDEELAAVPHYFINSHSITDTVNAAVFESYALNVADKLFKHSDHVIMAGGTGLYIKAFEQGIDPIPAISPDIRQAIVEEYTKNGLDWLQSVVRSEDPLFYDTGETRNPQRLMRALEVMRGTGQSIRSYQQGAKVNRPFAVEKIGIELPKELLHERINARVDQMMADGLLQEVESLVEFHQLPALRTVGYAEIFAYLDGQLGLDEAIERIKINTRQYAKRQMTWFRRDPTIRWISPAEFATVLNELSFR